MNGIHQLCASIVSIILLFFSSSSRNCKGEEEEEDEKRMHALWCIYNEQCRANPLRRCNLSKFSREKQNEMKKVIQSMRKGKQKQKYKNHHKLDWKHFNQAAVYKTINKHIKRNQFLFCSLMLSTVFNTK